MARGGKVKEQAGFWDWMAQRYARQPIADAAAYREKLSRTRKYFAPGCKVLEFGCGTGSTAIAHAPHVGHMHATDVSANMLAIGRAKASAEGISNISFQQAALVDLGGGAANWDVILGMSVLHLVADLAGDIALAYRLLKPGGVFVSSTPCIADMSPCFKYVAPLFTWLPFLPSVTIFSRDQLEAALMRAGFAIEERWQPGRDKALFIVARKPG